MSVKIGIKIKLAIVLSIVLFLATSTMGVILIAHQSGSLNAQMRSMAGTITDEFAHDSKIPLLQKDSLALNLLVKNILNYPGIDDVFVLSENMVIEGHKDLHEVGTIFEGKDLIGRASGEAPWLVKEDRDNIIFVSPIIFKDTRVGYTVISFSKDFIGERVSLAITSVVVIAVIAIIAASLLSIPIATRLLKPVFRLLSGTHEIALGNFDYRIAETGKDEIGDLVRSFNIMASELKKKEIMRGVFNRYVSPHVAEEILKDPESIRLGGERREVSVFFADIREFTSLSSRMAPEETVEVLNSYFTLITEIIFRFEGTVDKFIGDAVMAVFGSPVKSAEHLEQGIKAAVAVKKAVAKVNRMRENKGLVPFYMGMGLDSGTVIVGNMGSQARMEYTAVGEAVNMASRLAGVAEGGYILISEGTFRAVGENAVTEEMPDMEIKGFEAPVRLYNVVDVKGPWKDEVEASVEEAVSRLKDEGIIP